MEQHTNLYSPTGVGNKKEGTMEIVTCMTTSYYNTSNPTLPPPPLTPPWAHKLHNYCTNS